MTPEITPEQKEQLSAWAGQRDAILLEISGLRTELEGLTKSVTDVAGSITDATNRHNNILGQIKVLEDNEAEYNKRINIELAESLLTKSALQIEISYLKDCVALLKPQKEELEKDISKLAETFSSMNNRVEVLDTVVGHVTRVSTDNVALFNTLISQLKTSIEEIIEVNKKNVFETNIVIDKVPRMLVEIQKKGLIKNKI